MHVAAFAAGALLLTDKVGPRSSLALFHLACLVLAGCGLAAASDTTSGAGTAVRANATRIDRLAIDRLNQLINAGSFEVHVARAFPLDQAADAHRALNQHYLGKLALQPTP